jgi:uncharacterized repeat protein (TIGR02543 family)
MRNEYQMKNEKRKERKVKNSIVLTFLIFTFSFFFCLSCNNFIELPEINAPLVEDGYGRISVTLTAGEAAAPAMARTVFPSTAFDKYVYTFTKAGATTGVALSPDNEGFFALELGSYTVEVKAFIGDEEPYTLAASGESEEFSVGPGENDPVVVLLSEIDTGEEGEFSYTITYPADAEAEITLCTLPDLEEITLTPTDLDEGNGITETLELEAGFYLLTILITKDDQYAGISEVVYISPLLTTVYAKNYVDTDLVNAELTVTFDANGATSGTAPSQQTASPGTDITLPDGEGLTNTGYTFGGWNTDADGTGTKFDAGFEYTVAGNITLYAQWDPGYTVTFDKNGGDTEADPLIITVVPDTSIVTLPESPTRDGYTFTEWNTQEDGDGTAFTETTTVADNIIVYAQWNPITYTVTYDKNNDDAEGTTADSSHTYDVDQPLTANGFTCTGYAFTGWAETTDGTVEYTDEENVINLTSTAGAIVTLYAQWEEE